MERFCVWYAKRSRQKQLFPWKLPWKICIFTISAKQSRASSGSFRFIVSIRLDRREVLSSKENHVRKEGSANERTVEFNRI